MTKQEREALLYQPKHGRDRLSKADEAAMQTYCEAYKAFLDRSKTERESRRRIFCPPSSRP